jgi:SAM-dependent methyltransferase
MASKGRDLDFEVDFPIFKEKTKVNTIDFYNNYSKEYTKERGDVRGGFIEQYLKDDSDYLLKSMSGKKILDVGSGPGRDGLFFKSKGLDVVCIDASEEMVEICKKNGLAAKKMDIENIDYPESTFDAVWAYASLVHVPKRRIYSVLARISEILKHDGLFFAGMVEGENESLHKSVGKPNGERFFALYQDTELQEILNNYFDILSSKKLTMPNGEKYLNYLCKKKSDNCYKRI